MKYFIPLTLLSENGNPIRSKNVEVFDGSTKVTTLNYWKAGQYYSDEQIPEGQYTIKVDGYLYAEQVQIPQYTRGDIGFMTGTEPDPNGHYDVPAQGYFYYFDNGPNQYLWVGVNTVFNKWIKVSQEDEGSPLSPI
jgi:hypothetical protein